jgi:AGZA family xanthine/uracil permease-like MFS transporter
MTGVAVLILAFSGLMGLILNIVPLVVLLPILVYIGLVITSQAFAVTDKKHFPAVALSFIPLIAGYMTLNIKNAVNVSGGVLDYAALKGAGIPLLGWERLAGGDILVGMLIATIAIFIIDRQFLKSSVYCLISALLAYFGIIHAAKIGLGAGIEVAIGYLCMAIILVGMHFFRNDEEQVKK